MILMDEAKDRALSGRGDRAPADITGEIVAALAAEFTPESLTSTLGLDPDHVPVALWERCLLGAARAFLSRPGKQFRARLVEMAFYLAGGDPHRLPRGLPLAIEVLHAGSLVVDDIEDGSYTRRGGPALHHVVGLPVALNTGNWMYFWAMDLLRRAEMPADVELAVLRDVQLTLLHCHQGQALGIAAILGELHRHDIPGVVEAITRLKTGALLALAARLGGRAAAAPPAVIRALGTFGCRLGQGLQMVDDLGSVASPVRVDKGEEDLRLGRATWPWAWLAETDDEAAWTALLARQRDLASDDSQATRARALAAELTRRIEPIGRARLRAHLDAALESLRGEIGPSHALVAVEQEIERLVASYG